MVTKKKPVKKAAKLSPKQKMFIAEYLIDLNATQAAIRAGYSAKTANEQGSRLLANVSVQALIQEAMDKRVERTEITADYVLYGIKGVIERCLKPVITETFDEEGEKVVEINKFEPAPALKGFELLGRHLKLFTDKTELANAPGQTFKVEQSSTLSPEEAWQKYSNGEI